MNNICEYNQCTACAACVNICVHNCITLTEDKFGELHPVVDNDRCVNCGLCERACPNNIQPTFYTPKKCYASWIDDIDKRRICASGGIGTIMSEYVIKNSGVVFGSRYDEDLNPIMTYTETLEGVEKFKGSRYVQSFVGNDTLKNVKKFLQTNKLVLFIGTPCQIAGLLGYLRKSYENLITVDLICHGVSPSSYLKQEISFLCEKYKLRGIADVRFRGNDGNDYQLTIWDENKKKIFPRDNLFQKMTYSDASQQYYIQGFLKGVSMRENCYGCKYARPERISDITIGDFIGLGKNTPFPYSTKNVSSVILNTDKGAAFYELVSSYMQVLNNVERTYEERLMYKPSLVHPFPRHILNKKFRDAYEKCGFVTSIRSVLYKDFKERQFKYFMKLPLKISKKILVFFSCRNSNKYSEHTIL